MSVRLPISSLTSTQQAQYRKELTFQYKQKNIMRNQRRPPPPKIVKAYAESTSTSTEESHVSLPVAWAWKNLKQYNAHEVQQLGYQQKLQPWSDLQRDELQQVVTLLEKRRTVALTLRTGAGKTAVALFAACHLNLLTVVLVHNSNHCAQWTNEIEHYTTARSEVVETNTNGIRRDTQIIVCLYKRWAKIPESIRRSVGLLIIDECDEFNNKTGVEAILSMQPAYCIGATATFVRPGTGLETIMYSVLGHFFVTRQFDVDFDVAKILTGITGDEIPSEHTRGCDWNTLKHSLLYNPKRNKIIVDVCRIYKEQGKKMMIICTEIKHVKILHQMLTEAGLDNDYMCDDKDTYEDAPGRILIGTAKCCGRGFDQQSACPNWCGERIDWVLFADFVNNDADRMQWAGRAFRTKNTPVIAQLVDRNPTIQRQWKNAEKMYLSMGGKIQEYEMTGA